MSAPAEFVTRRGFARLDKCSERRVRNGVRDGDLPTLPDKTIPAALAGTAWRARNAEQPQAADSNPDARAVSAPSLADARRRHEIVLARQRRQEWNKRSKEWVLATTFERAWRTEVREIAETLTPIARLAAPQVVGKTPAVIQGILRDVVHEALTAASAGCRDCPPAPTDREPVIPTSLTRVEAQRLQIEDATRIRQLELDISTGTVVNLTKTVALVATALSQVRTRVLAFQAELPPRLFGRGKADCERIIAKAVNDALEDLISSAPDKKGETNADHPRSESRNPKARSRGASAGLEGHKGRPATRRARDSSDQR